MSKGKNGCDTYAQGWNKGPQTCHSCDETTRDFSSGSFAECYALCGEMYAQAPTKARAACEDGCKYMDTHARGTCSVCDPDACIGIRDACRDLQSKSKGKNGCDTYA